jgi:hypothetical protein
MRPAPKQRAFEYVYPHIPKITMFGIALTKLQISAAFVIASAFSTHPRRNVRFGS